MSPGGSIVASFENVESFFALHIPPDHLIRTDFEQEGVIPEVLYGSFENLQSMLGLQITKSNRSKSFERKCFSDFFVLELILVRILKSGEMVGGKIFSSFFVSDLNIEFLEQKDPPH
ncbi:hypothetical protein Tco_0330200 [Tanacetum coccineum]